MNLRPYQDKSIAELAQCLTKHRKVMYQLPTGGGKTVTFAGICERYLEKQTKDVLIIVHRKKLLKQARNTIYAITGLPTQSIIAGMKRVPKARIYIAMVESLKNRIPDNIGLVIVDEAHIANFNKVHDWFTTQLIVGFTATPLSANKMKPCKMFYQEIVIGETIPNLIKDGYLSQNITYCPTDVVQRRLLTLASNGDYSEREMGETYSQPKYIKNTIREYKRHADGTKAIVFNCSIEHSLLVNEAFVKAGYKSKHLDYNMSDEQEDEIYNWYKNTPCAILCNVAKLTAGFDEPTIETVIVNRATTSLPLWLQMTGRGSRITDWKKLFTIIDMGGNADEHHDWNYGHDWREIFHNPKPKKKKNKQPLAYKSCDACEALITVQTKICPICGHDHRTAMQAEQEQMLGEGYMIVTKGIDVEKLIEINQQRKEYYVLFDISRKLCAPITDKRNPEMIYETVLADYHAKAQEWCKTMGKKWNQWHKDFCAEVLAKELGMERVEQ